LRRFPGNKRSVRYWEASPSRQASPRSCSTSFICSGVARMVSAPSSAFGTTITSRPKMAEDRGLQGLNLARVGVLQQDCAIDQCPQPDPVCRLVQGDDDRPGAKRGGEKAVRLEEAVQNLFLAEAPDLEVSRAWTGTRNRKSHSARFFPPVFGSIRPARSFVPGRGHPESSIPGALNSPESTAVPGWVRRGFARTGCVAGGSRGAPARPLGLIRRRLGLFFLFLFRFNRGAGFLGQAHPCAVIVVPAPVSAQALALRFSSSS